MSKSKSQHPKSASPELGRGLKSGKVVPAKKPSATSSAAIRETIESVVIAFVLAFLFRTFEAEAFVIPTGSMAPTLMGRHKDLECPYCGYRYQVSASEEVDQATGRQNGAMVTSGTCPMCRYPADLGPRNRQNESYPSYKGDRILVGKFAYEFSDPGRWDVAVFRYPGDAQTNYIKRLVGLPGETVRIQYGNIYVSRDGGEFAIARKAPHKLLAMLQPVFDNDLMPRIARYGWPARWRTDADVDNAWSLCDDGASYQTASEPSDTAWLRYYHLTPREKQWRDAEREGEAPPDDPVRPTLIDDFLAYNSGHGREPSGRHWVGDLALKCTVDVQSDTGDLVFEFIRGGRTFRCLVDLGTGRATLSINGLGEDEYRPTAETKLRGRGRYDVIFSNCDDQLRLWIGGEPVVFGDSDATTCYAPLSNNDPQPADLAPVGIGVRAAAVRVSDLQVLRDIYYIARPQADQYHHGRADAEVGDDAWFERPGKWPPGFLDDKFSDFRLGNDQYLALGDNSAKSKDSRLWPKEPDPLPHFVRRDLLIGKAFFIYWPHSWNRPIPFWPNFRRMGFVR